MWQRIMAVGIYLIWINIGLASIEEACICRDVLCLKVQSIMLLNSCSCRISQFSDFHLRNVVQCSKVFVGAVDAAAGHY